MAAREALFSRMAVHDFAGGSLVLPALASVVGWDTRRCCFQLELVELCDVKEARQYGHKSTF
jgi:hypothetical protein